MQGSARVKHNSSQCSLSGTGEESPSEYEDGDSDAAPLHLETQERAGEMPLTSPFEEPEAQEAEDTISPDQERCAPAIRDLSVHPTLVRPRFACPSCPRMQPIPATLRIVHIPLHGARLFEDMLHC